MKIRYVDHVNIVVRDLDVAKDFFLNLGLTVIAERTLSGKWIDQTVGLKDVRARFVAMGISNAQTVIELLVYDNPSGSIDPLISSPNRVGFRHIAFNVDDIGAWYQKLQTLGIECFSEVQEVPNYRSKKIIYFNGPEGIILELAEYPSGKE